MDTQSRGSPQPITLTMFERANKATGTRRETTWPELVDWLKSSAPVAPIKESLPLIKLAGFTGDHRSNDTIEMIYGIEADYDAGEVHPAVAAAQLVDAGLCGVVLTTPSHRPEAPRWRVLCPTSRPLAPAERHGLPTRRVAS
ncbi:MAG: hypothetical protein K5799_11390 [Erythrobacter sp.]|nr:hypothetical protein [Erythrobacter sp.]